MEHTNDDEETGFDISDYLRDPDEVGASEYRAIYDTIEESEPEDASHALAIVEEFENWARAIKANLEEEMAKKGKK